MNAQELKEKYSDLYGYMATSRDPDNMKAFGKVMTEMFMWMADNKSEAAQEWLDKLESIKWDNYLTPKEAEKIVSNMKPQAPWSRDKWKEVMTQRGYEMEDEPCYNSCSLWVTMNMIMSDSSGTLEKYVNGDKLFDAVYELAVDKLCDEDGKFSIRKYFDL